MNGARNFRARRYHLLIVLALLAAPVQGRPDSDLTGNWEVTEKPIEFPTLPGTTNHWLIVQSGTMITLRDTGPSEFFYIGDIDPDTGALSFSGQGGGCFSNSSPTAPDTFTGSLTSGDTFEATGVVQVQGSPFNCFSAGVTLSATRTPCGNGGIDSDEQCDDGDVAGVDCCSPDCTIMPDGAVCDDGTSAVPVASCIGGSCIAPLPTCAGDCDETGSVVVGEVVRCVNVALDRAVPSSCVACDADGDGNVGVTDLVTSVNDLLGGC